MSIISTMNQIYKEKSWTYHVYANKNKNITSRGNYAIWL